VCSNDANYFTGTTESREGSSLQKFRRLQKNSQCNMVFSVIFYGFSYSFSAPTPEIKVKSGFNLQFNCIFKLSVKLN